jgi:GR25 family glycosyltransferase involved in LPS biosynthesis/glycosyltransferase involved in cell wall biosynthesis
VTKRIESVEAIAERATRPSICLNMIVRNEAHIVEESLTCLLPLIDTWVIVDTGSSDGTQDLIRGFFKEHGVPGELHERPWVDFGHNRSEALALCAGKADYAWVFDADDLVIGDIDLSGLTADSYLLQFGSEFTYWRTQIFGLSKPWEYRGVVHEYPVCLEPGATQERLEGNYHVESRRLGGRNRTGDKYERDSALLARALEADPNDTRSMFYLAQSRMDAGDLDGAYDYYTRRTHMGGWDEEVYYSHLQRARVLERLGKPWEEVLGVYLHAWEFRPTRAEALVEISRHYRFNGEFNLGYHFAKLACEIPLPENDVLFVRADSYNWRRFDDRAICAFYLGKHQESFNLCNQLLDGPFLPDNERTRILGNRDFVSEHILCQPPAYPADIIAGIVDRQANKPRKRLRVTVTITTCRRLDLFEQTMDSFLTHCLDRDQIDRWICIDDGSTAKDRRRMQERYPFFEFILKPRRDAGHARSMNMLRDEVSSPLWLHLEDDWRFFIDDHYVSRARAVLADDPSIAQVLFNRNYAEKLDDRDVGGGYPKRTEADRTPYRLHQHADPGTPEYHDAVNALPVGRGSNIWWPNFSLRPSIMRTKALKKLGPFNEEADHFELDLARRFTAAGLRSAFFDKTTCVHLGPLSVDRSPNRRPNAYALNGQPQFGKRIVSPSTATDTGAFADLPIRMINLDRRADRLERMKSEFTRVGEEALAPNVVRFAAIDGQTLELTPEIEFMFRGNDFDFRRGIVACALSHLELWRDVAEGDGRSMLIFEDDITLVDDFTAQLADVLGALKDRDDVDLVFLGYQRWLNAPAVSTDNTAPQLQPMQWEHFLGGTFAYVLTRVGARKLLEIVDRDGIQTGIDWLPLRHNAEMVALEISPALVSAQLAWPGQSGDSDIQHEFASLDTNSQVTHSDRDHP